MFYLKNKDLIFAISTWFFPLNQSTINTLVEHISRKKFMEEISCYTCYSLEMDSVERLDCLLLCSLNTFNLLQIWRLGKIQSSGMRRSESGIYQMDRIVSESVVIWFDR